MIILPTEEYQASLHACSYVPREPRNVHDTTEYMEPVEAAETLISKHAWKSVVSNLQLNNVQERQAVIRP